MSNVQQISFAHRFRSSRHFEEAQLRLINFLGLDWSKSNTNSIWRSPPDEISQTVIMVLLMKNGVTAREETGGSMLLLQLKVSPSFNFLTRFSFFNFMVAPFFVFPCILLLFNFSSFSFSFSFAPCFFLQLAPFSFVQNRSCSLLWNYPESSSFTMQQAMLLVYFWANTSTVQYNTCYIRMWDAYDQLI